MPRCYLELAVILSVIVQATQSQASERGSGVVQDSNNGAAQPEGASAGLDGESLLAPKRLGGYFQADLVPFVVGGAGIALGAAADVSYVGQVPYRLDVRASPIVLAFKDGASQATAFFVAEAMFDSHLIGIGPALGYTMGRISGPTLGGRVRLGATDGLNVTLRASALREPIPQAYPIGTAAPAPSYRFAFADLDLRLAVPVADRWTMIANAAFLRDTLWRASVGVNTRLTKTRDHGAMFLTAGGGLALLEATFAAKPESDTQGFMGGLMLDLGYSVRL